RNDGFVRQQQLDLAAHVGAQGLTFGHRRPGCEWPLHVVSDSERFAGERDDATEVIGLDSEQQWKNDHHTRTYPLVMTADADIGDVARVVERRNAREVAQEEIAKLDVEPLRDGQ